MMNEKRDLFDLSTEIRGVAMTITGLGNQLDTNSDSLTAVTMKEALYGVKVHLERISEDLERLEVTKA